MVTDATSEKAAKTAPALTEADIQVGKVYRGKRRRENLFVAGKYDDRAVVWIGKKWTYRLKDPATGKYYLRRSYNPGAYVTHVQYDSYSVAVGRHLPYTPMASFLKWALCEVKEDGSLIDEAKA